MSIVSTWWNTPPPPPHPNQRDWILRGPCLSSFRLPQNLFNHMDRQSPHRRYSVLVRSREMTGIVAKHCRGRWGGGGGKDYRNQNRYIGPVDLNHGQINYIKTPNPIYRIFFKINLLTDFAALFLTDFMDWRYIYSWLVFSTQLVNCCPHGRRNYILYYCPSTFLLSDLLPPPPFPN